MKKIDFYFECVEMVLIPIILYFLASVIFAALAYTAFYSVITTSFVAGCFFTGLIPFGAVVMFVIIKDNIEELKYDYNKYYKNL